MPSVARPAAPSGRDASRAVRETDPPGIPRPSSLTHTPRRRWSAAFWGVAGPGVSPARALTVSLSLPGRAGADGRVRCVIRKRTAVAARVDRPPAHAGEQFGRGELQ